MNKYLATEFLFNINRVQIEPVDKLFLLVGAIAMAIAFVLKLAAKFSPGPVDAKYRNKLFGPFLFLGLSEIIWYGFRIQLVRFFGSHFVAILLVLISVVWIVMALWKMFKAYSQEKQAWEKEQVKAKYLPGKV